MKERRTINIGNMTCYHCVMAVTRVLRMFDRVDVIEVTQGRAVIAYDPDDLDFGKLAEALGRIGYTVIE